MVTETLGPVAQRLEQGTHNPLVVGSNPTGPTSLRLSAAKAEAVTSKLRMKRRRTVYFVEEIRAPASAWQALTVSPLVRFYAFKSVYLRLYTAQPSGCIDPLHGVYFRFEG